MSADRGKRWIFRSILVFFGIFVAIGFGEVGLRLLTVKEGGQLVIERTKLAPLELVTPEQRLCAREGPPGDTYFALDHQLGWTPRPGTRDKKSGIYVANSLGLRSLPREDSAEPRSGVTRILAVGDSFTHCDEVPYEESWTHYLEQELGERFEVLNGGVSGYGTDQALLRWRLLSPRLKPRIVVLGVLLWDAYRNVNIFRHFEHPGPSFPFSKPRFVLDGDSIKPVNLPTLDVKEIPSVLESFPDHPLARHEHWYVPSLYDESILDFSRLYRFLRSRVAWQKRFKLQDDALRPGSEALKITARTAKLFCEEVKAAGSVPLVLIIPSHKELGGARSGGGSSGGGPLQALLAELKAAGVAPLLDLTAAMLGALAEREPSTFYVGGVGHLSSEGNKNLAKLLAPEILRLSN